MEKGLHTLNVKLRWFEYKLKETEHKLGTTNLKASNLEEIVNGLNAEAKLQKKEMARIKDEATDWGIDVGFKIFRWLLLKLHPHFDMGTLKAYVSNEVINEAMNEMERERMATQGATGPSGGDPAADTKASAKLEEVVKIDGVENN